MTGSRSSDSSSDSSSVSSNDESGDTNSTVSSEPKHDLDLLRYGTRHSLLHTLQEKLISYSLVNPLSYLDVWAGGELNNTSDASGNYDNNSSPQKYLDSFASILSNGTDTLLAGSSSIVGSTGNLFAALISPIATPDSNDKNDTVTKEESTLMPDFNKESINKFFTGLGTGIVSIIPDIAPNILAPNTDINDDDESIDSSSNCLDNHSNSMSIDDINEVSKFENRLESSGFKANLHFPSKPGSPQTARVCVIKKQLSPSPTIICTVSFNKKYKSLVFSISDIRNITRGGEISRSRQDRDRSVSIMINNNDDSSKGKLNFEFENSSIAGSFFHGFVLICKKYMNDKVEVSEVIEDSDDNIVLRSILSAKTIKPFNSPAVDDNNDVDKDKDTTNGSLISRLRRSFTIRSPSPQNGDELMKSSPVGTPSPSLITRVRKSFTSIQHAAGDIDPVDDLTAPVGTTSPSLWTRVRKSFTLKQQSAGDIDPVDDLTAPVGTSSPSLMAKLAKSVSSRHVKSSPSGTDDVLLSSAFTSFKNGSSSKIESHALNETPETDSLQSSPVSTMAPTVNVNMISNYDTFKPQSVEELLAAYKEKVRNSDLISSYEAFKPQSVEDLLVAHEEKLREACVVQS